MSSFVGNVRWTALSILTAAALQAGPGTSYADVNRTPIAIPLIGTEITASPYPSSITLNPVEGPAQTGQISVTLHGVTHPCPQEIAVLLVHGADKWLLMNNAGGCRPMQGTTIEFVSNTNLPTIQETPQPFGQPFGEFIRVQPSFNGAQPMPPAPYPAGGVLTLGMPTEIEDLAGKWDLYVLDKGGANRGVIAGGWSLNYDTAVRLLSNPNAQETAVTVTYLLQDGTAIPKSFTMPGNSRKTINLEDEDDRLKNAAVSTVVSSVLPIVAERAIYWPNINDGWREAHNSFGVTEAARRWAVADGRLGGARGHDTYILLANPNPVPAEVRVRFLKPGVEIVRDYRLNPTSRLTAGTNVTATRMPPR